MFPGPFSVCDSFTAIPVIIRQLSRETFWLRRLERSLPISFCCFQLAKAKLSEAQGWDHFQEFGFAFVWETDLTFHLHESQLNHYLSQNFPFKACYRKNSHHSKQSWACCVSGPTTEPAKSLKPPSCIFCSGEFIPDFVLSQPGTSRCWYWERYFSMENNDNT